jgi:hypothetical protein
VLVDSEGKGAVKSVVDRREADNVPRVWRGRVRAAPELPRTISEFLTQYAASPRTMTDDLEARVAALPYWLQGGSTSARRAFNTAFVVDDG